MKSSAILVVACLIAGLAHAGADQTLQLQLGVPATVGTNGLHITFTAVTNDSRCPTGAQCSVAGYAHALLHLEQPGEQPVTVKLGLTAGPLFPEAPPSAVTYAGTVIWLTALEPYPTLQPPPKKAASVLTVRIRPPK